MGAWVGGSVLVVDVGVVLAVTERQPREDCQELFFKIED